MAEELLQLTVFTVGDEEYGVDILRVRAIERLSEITKVPHAPPYVDGVINLRGKIIPVVDLRKRMGLEPRPLDKSAKIVVVECGDETVGLRVDGVREVLRVPSSQTEPPPDLATQDVDYIERLAKLDGRLILVLNVERILDAGGSGAFQAAAKPVA
ncbi:MAG: chemotaxis protein CheW [candidate division KSB1 bacterium]|nr:chemotaxis protein CheW [candidate division KSB1 bacterium]